MGQSYTGRWGQTQQQNQNQYKSRKKSTNMDLDRIITVHFKVNYKKSHVNIHIKNHKQLCSLDITQQADVLFCGNQIKNRWL